MTTTATMEPTLEVLLVYTMRPLVLALALMGYLELVRTTLLHLGPRGAAAASAAWIFLMALMDFLRRRRSVVPPPPRMLMAEAVAGSLLILILARRGVTWLLIGTLAASIMGILWIDA